MYSKWNQPHLLLSGQNYFQLFGNAGINPKLLRFLLGTITCTEWPHKMPRPRVPPPHITVY